MELTAPDVARLLGVAEKEVYRWANDGELPSYQINGQLRFHPAELLEWAALRQKPVSPAIFADMENGHRLPELAAALELGGVFHAVPGTDRPSVLQAIVERLRLPNPADRELLVPVLLAQEALGTSAIGDGLAIPHVRNPVVLAGASALVAVFYLTTPVGLGAPDKKPVHTLIFIVTPTVRVHLQLLAKLSAALHDPTFRNAVRVHADLATLTAAARRIDATLPTRPGSQASS